MVDITALFKFTYGIYILGAHDEDKLGGCIVNTVFQLTAEPIKIGVSVSKHNQTCEFIEKSGSFSVTVLEEETDSKLLGKFGYRTGKEIDKFKDTDYKLDMNGDPLINSGAVAHISAKVLEKIDMDTHYFYIAEVNAAEKLNEHAVMTYNYYRDVKKLQSSKYAPTFVKKDN